ncbi:MAG: NADAR family protein [Anaerolineae bacterium]|nr:NADAR family protein [Anaerolineae bacterium]
MFLDYFRIGLEVNLETIYFYSTQDEYGCFSNFSQHGFELDGQYWKTSEHYFQAQKFVGTKYEEQVRLAKTAKQAAELGRRRDFPLRRDWERVKDQVMRRAVLRKFETHADIRDILLNTGDSQIVENAPGDYYWGVGKDGSGQNRLGQILMEVRAILREKKQGA